MNEPAGRPGRATRPASIANVDLLRGTAALAVLVWHYQHFFYSQTGAGLTDRSLQPFYQNLRWLYDYGDHGVQFFWILSGFVFFHAYKAHERITLRDFAVNRFSRLYPLHLITLVLVAWLQWVSFKLLGHYQIYPFNDLYHFLLNFFMVSHWGWQKGWSFNAPIWSVSVEIVIYGFFFAYMKSLRINLLSAATWLLLTWVAFQGMSANFFSQCALLFVLGGVVHELHDSLNRWLPTWVPAVLAGAALGISAYGLHLNGKWSQNLVYFGLFPSLIWLCTAIENLGVSSGKLGQATGNLTYASYLIHIPIQIASMTIMDLVGMNRFSWATTPSFFMAFLVAVFFCSHLVFKHIEMPLKNLIRQRFSTHPAGRLG